MAKYRPPVPPEVAAEVLAANLHTCCICRQARRHVQLHHIDGNPANNDETNIAVLCLDCHSRVTGDEGLGRSFAPNEVAIYKTEWEARCSDETGEDGGGADDHDDDVDEPAETDHEVIALPSGEHHVYEYELEEGDSIVATVDSDYPIHVYIADLGRYRRWARGEQPRGLAESPSVYSAGMDFVAPREGKYLLWIANHNDEDEEDAEVTVDVAIWDGDEDE